MFETVGSNSGLVRTGLIRSDGGERTLVKSRKYDRSASTAVAGDIAAGGHRCRYALAALTRCERCVSFHPLPTRAAAPRRDRLLI